MGWLIELLFGALRELCSQFIIDMMDIASGMFTEVLSCDLNLFEGLFGVAESLYKNAIVPVAIVLLLMILAWQLFKSMFGRMGTSSEDPIELVFRSGFCLFMIAFAKNIVNYILGIAGTPYQWITGTSIPVDSFSGYVSALDAASSALGGDAISIQLLMLIMHFVVAWNYFKMLFILAERYVLLGVFSYTSPLAFAMGGSKATNNVLASWTKMFGGQVMVVLLDAWCVKMFLSAYGNLMASGYGFTKFFAATMCLIGFCKITAKLDSYMGSLGVNLGRITGGMGGLGALAMAGRLLQGGSRLAGGKGGGNRGPGEGTMNFGNGRTIPLGKGMPDFADFGKGSLANGKGIGGMDETAGIKPGERSLSPETENDIGVFGAQENAIDPILPFGDPETMEQSMENAQGMENIQGMDVPEMEESFGATFSGNEDGLEPYPMEGEPFADGSGFWGMDGLTESGFGMSDMESISSTLEEADSSGIQTESGEIPGIAETSESVGTISGDQISEYGESGFGENGSFGNITSTDSISENSQSGIGNVGTAIGTGGSITEKPFGDIHSGESYGGIAGGTHDIHAGTETSTFAENVGAGVYGSESGDTSAGTGAYEFERDGEQFMRYDSGMYEKPDGSYQTIHENGKAFYELPENEKAPARLPEAKAVLERDGTIRLEQEKHTHKESSKALEQKIPMEQPVPAETAHEQKRREKRSEINRNLRRGGRQKENHKRR